MCLRASPPCNIYLSQYTRGTRCSITFWFYFHGGNTGSNPVGDAKSNQQLRINDRIFLRHKKAHFQSCLPVAIT